MAEFLKEGTAIEDTLHPDRIVIGTENKKPRKILSDLHAPFKSPLVHTNLETAELIKYTTIFRAPESYISEARNNFGGWLYRSLDYVDSLKTNATDPIKVKKLKINVFKAFIARFNQLLNYGTRQQIREADKPIYDEAQLQLTKASPAFRQVYQDTQQPL